MKEAGQSLTQDRFAKLLGRTVATVKSLETGRLALSEELAKRISQVTGVSLPWLLKGNGEEAIRGRDGKSYSLEHLERAQFDLRDRKEGREPTGLKRATIANTGTHTADLVKEMASRFAKHPDGEFRMWKLQQAVKRIAEEFPAGS